MRLVEFEQLRPGMINGQHLYGPNGELLCKQGTELKELYLNKIKGYGIPHLYIIDALSEDVEVHCTISQEVKNEAYRNIKKLYTAILQKTNSYHSVMQECLNSVDKITEDIIAEKIDLFDIFDIKMMDEYVYQHPVNVAIISIIIGKSLSLSSLELYRLGLGAFLFDVGQMFVPQDILNKKTTYTDSDIKAMQKHTENGYRFAKDEFNLPMKSYLAILQHHERYDGTGYPNGKKGKEISEYGRIVAIADVYDALSSRKPYREAMSPVMAFKAILEGANKEFDPDIVKIFASKICPYPLGFTINLPDKRTGIIQQNYTDRPFNPLVKIIMENDVILTDPYTIRL